MLETQSIGETPRLTLWEKRRPIALRDLIIKKICLNAIFLLNAAALGIAVYCIVAYCPIPTKALITAPIFGGIFAAIAFLKLPLCGFTKIKYKELTNPAHQLGKGLAILFFGPWLLIKNQIDETPYHDSELARVISKELREGDFEQISKKYGENFRNLFRYGFIQGIKAKKLIKLHDKFVPVAKGLAHTKKSHIEGKEDEYTILSTKKESIETRWKEMKTKFVDSLPLPAAPHYNYSSWKGRFELYLRDLVFSPKDFMGDPPHKKEVDLSTLLER